MLNIFDCDAPPKTGERFEQLLACQGVVVERIVSSSTPDDTLYDQAQDEWVVLLKGQATLEVSGNARELRAGDSQFIPAHTKHRVLRCSTGALWLAVHIKRSATGA